MIRQFLRCHVCVALTALIAASACSSAQLGTRPIPLADHKPWRTLISDSTFRIAMDAQHVERAPGNAWLMTFITTHSKPTGPDSMRFDRGRIRLLVQCDPLRFKSVSQELSLGDARPVFRHRWEQSGPNAAPWVIPAQGSTDDTFLRAACNMDIIHGRK